MNVRKDKSVLIVEDNADIAEAMKMYCEKMGCFRLVIIAPDGIDATRKIENQKFDLVILDLNLPKKGGIDLLRILEKTDGKTGVASLEKVVICSGNLEKETASIALKAGVKNFLTKPFNEALFQQKAIAALKA